MTDFIDEISLMIPAYLRGDLEPDETARVEAAAIAHPEVKADINFQRSLRDSLQSDKIESTSDELGWARLSRAMDLVDSDAQAKFDDMPEAANDRPVRQNRFWMGATAALAVLAAGQFGLMSLTNSDDATDARYELVTESVDGTVMKVAPSEDMSVQDFSALLNEVNGQIISGPSAIGLYELKFETEADCKAAIKYTEARLESVSGCS